jgi:organic hydroperoxide reductase OsmC/OhrA
MRNFFSTLLDLLMRIVAKVTNSLHNHSVDVATDGAQHPITIAPKASGPGSSVNGGELLFLALATCYCNDLYREAAARNITIHAVDVEVSGEFGGRGEPATGITYRVTVRAEASDADLTALLAETDRVAEIQNTVRHGCPVVFNEGA